MEGAEAGDLYILPEAFTTGFLGEAPEADEGMDGPTVGWLRETAARHGAAICGSAVISDAAAGRNGVGTYYEDLVSQLRPCVGDISLLAPQADAKADHQWFSIPLPGDATQRLAYPKTCELAKFLDTHAPSVVILPTVGPYAVLGLRLARHRGLPVCMAYHTNFARLLDLYWSKWLAVPFRHMLNSLTRWMVKRSDCVICMNVESMEEARSSGAQRARIVGTPLSADFLDTPRRPLSPGLKSVLFRAEDTSGSGMFEHFIGHGSLFDNGAVGRQIAG